MGVWVADVNGGSGGFLVDYLVSAALVAGAAVQRESSVTEDGEALICTTTAATNFSGCTSNAVTHSNAPTAEPTGIGHSPQNIARIVVAPSSVWRFHVLGGAAAGTALQPSTATPANILVQDTASTTVITDTAVGTVDMSGGLIKGRTGANVGAIRKMTVNTSATSATVGHAFINSAAVGDSFIRLPFSRSAIDMQLTTAIDEANGIIAYGTGAPFSVVNVIIDEQNDDAWVDVVARDHIFSPISA